MDLRHEVGESVELVDLGGSLWRYVYGGKPKAFFHPLCTPAGHNLTLIEPSDHPWHRGLWFTIKFVNGENFWEERAPHGRQRTVTHPVVRHDDTGGIHLSTWLHWVRPEDGDVVIDEERLIGYVPIDAGAYALDLTFSLVPRFDVVLDRTPFEGWGGYGGLCLRGNRDWQGTRLLFPDGTTSDRPTPVAAEWCDLSGDLDGGRQTGGIAIFDHPTNARHPVPWYGATGPSHYFNAAFLFHESLSLPAGEELRLRYRVYVHDGIPDILQLQSEYERYVSGARKDQTVMRA